MAPSQLYSNILPPKVDLTEARRAEGSRRSLYRHCSCSCPYNGPVDVKRKLMQMATSNKWLVGRMGSPRRSSVEGERKLWLHSAGRFLRWNLLHAPRSPWGHWGGSTTQYCRPRGFERGSAAAIESNCMPLPAFRGSCGKYTDNLW